MSFFEIIHQAHQAVRSGNDGQTTIKHALMHANYLGSSPEVCAHLQNCEALAACGDPVDIGEHARAQAVSAPLRLGRPMQGARRPARLYTMIKMDSADRRPKRGKSAVIEGLIDKFKLGDSGGFYKFDAVRLAVVEETFNQQQVSELMEDLRNLAPNDSDRWFWLSDERAPDAVLSSHLRRLGLYGWRRVKKHEPLLLLEWGEPTATLFKPTWLHNGLYFYFDSAADCSDHGYTRCLATGERGCKEWVAIASSLGPPSRAHLLQADRRIVLDDPPEGFWRGSVNRIRS